jgi:hypothetical protein
MSSNHTHAVLTGGTGDFAMLTGAITIVRLVWPFLREVFFGRESTKAWFKKNGLTLVWMLFIVLMLGAIVNKEGQDNASLTADNAALRVQVKQLQTQGPALCPHKPAEIPQVASSHYVPAPSPADAEHDKQQQAVLDELRQIKNDEEQ